jgi:hypothetical protein
MILVDTSIWVDHLNAAGHPLELFLELGQVMMHPVVLGELACGNLRNRQQILTLLRQLPTARCASHGEVLYFIEQKGLMGKGIGYVDAHLLAAVALGGMQYLWTRDQRLAQTAEALGVASKPRYPGGGLHEPRPA